MAAARHELKEDELPVSDFYTLLGARTYVRTDRRIVALCALQGGARKELKLYEWNYKGGDKGWKVALANINVAGINLKQLAADAEALAAEHGIPLNWR